MIGADLIIILILETVTVYLLLLGFHSLRFRVGFTPFYSLIGITAAVNSWITNIGVQAQAAGMTFMVGSSVFYTSLLIGVFAVYVLDGPRPARVAIFTIARVSVFMPIVVAVVHTQVTISGIASTSLIPQPGIRSNIASVIAIIADLVFLAMAWEFLGKPNLRIKMRLRVFLTLLGVMWLDVFLFSTLAFAGTPDHLSIMKGTLLSRFVISLFACPLLYTYIKWQNGKTLSVMTNRPVLSILKEVAEVKAQRGQAHQKTGEH